ncbi:MAG: type II toxin-antitoxin system PemK/MazF family toxin [Bryobacteraceae bacterium]|jgi:mRNA interferase MazF
MNPRPGEVWLADLGLAARPRPVVIVSRSDPDPPRALVLYVPLTTQNRLSQYEVPLPRLPYLDRPSVANVQGIGSIPTVRLERKLGRVPEDVLLKLKAALMFALDLESAPR